MFKKIYFSNFHLKTNILAQLEFRLIPTEHTYSVFFELWLAGKR